MIFQKKKLDVDIYAGENGKNDSQEHKIWSFDLNQLPIADSTPVFEQDIACIWSSNTLCASFTRWKMIA